MALFNLGGGSLYRTAGDGWVSSGQGLGTAGIQSVAIEPGRPQVRWVGQQEKIFRSANGGASWTERSSGLPGNCCLVGYIRPDPRGNGTVYAGTRRGGLFKTTNDGGSWSLVNAELDFDLAAVSIDPKNPDRVYAGGINGNVYRSENGGATWTTGGNLGAPVGSLVVDPRAGSDVLYGSASGTGVFRSADRGATWTPLAEGLGTVATGVLALDLRGSVLTLLVATSGSGVFARTVSLGALDAPIDFTSTPTQPREGEAVRFNAVGAPAGAQVAWDFGDGSSADGAGPEHTFPGPGTYQVTLHVGLGAQAAAKTHAVTVGEGGSAEPCAPGPTVFCARQGRFRVAVEWHDFAGHTGPGTLTTQSSDSGLFWFFGEANWEMLVKVLDGCGLNQHYWVFSAATTNVEYTLRVTDTTNGTQWTYHNPSGTAAPAITDTSALDTCP
jgi:PKD repeat protein